MRGICWAREVGAGGVANERGRSVVAAAPALRPSAEGYGPAARVSDAGTEVPANRMKEDPGGSDARILESGYGEAKK